MSSKPEEDNLIIDIDTLEDVLHDTVIIDDMSNYSITTPYFYGSGMAGAGAGSVTVSTAGAMGSTGGLYSTTGMNGSSWGTLTSNPGINVSGDATFEGDIKWKGRSLGKLLESIEDRLAILQEPDPKKLEKYAALKKAYEHYKTLERLIGED